MSSLLAAARLIFILAALGISELNERLDDHVDNNGDCTDPAPNTAKGSSMLQSRRAKQPLNTNPSAPASEPAGRAAPAAHAAVADEALANLKGPHQQNEATTWPPVLMPQASDITNSSAAVHQNLKTLQQQSTADTMPSLSTALFSLMPVSLSLSAFGFILAVAHYLRCHEAAEDGQLRPIAITGSIEGPAQQGKPPRKEPKASERESSSAASASTKTTESASPQSPPDKANSPRVPSEDLTHGDDGDAAAGARSAEASEWLSAEGEPEP